MQHNWLNYLCPKCGDRGPLVKYTEPMIFDKEFDPPPFLAVRCKLCGYFQSFPTLDSKEETQ